MKPYLIAEIGINHNGDLETAKRLIDAVFACRWDCVKFQKRDPDVCVPEDQKNVTRDTPWGRMTYLEYRKRIEFGEKEYDYIEEYCKKKPLDWAASVWDIPSFKFITKYNIPFIKIPSAKLTDHRLLLNCAAESGKKVILSTGMSTLVEIDMAVNILKRYDSNFVLLHTNSAYPTPREDLNLNCINMLRKRYDCEVGYSGHEPDLEPSVLAASLGASIIERHITLDHNMWGTDQQASLEITGMDILRQRIMDIDTILGDGEKRVTEKEKEIRKKLRGY